MARELDNVRKAAFNITAAFEGAGYGAYQSYDQGIVSYGRFQFTLASGSLFTVLEKYLKMASTPIADQLRTQYLQRVHDRDETLRKDEKLKSLLRSAADEPAMQAAQDEVATTKYWDLVQGLSIQPRNIQTPLGQALVFDMAINHGPRHDMLNLAEDALGVAPKSRMPDNGANEKDMIERTARIRQERMHRLADKHGWEGLRVRGDFWVKLAEQGDWELQGDLNGMITVKPGRRVQVFFAGEEAPGAPLAAVSAAETTYPVDVVSRDAEIVAYAPVPSAPPAEPGVDEAERIRRAAFDITAAFEGSSYATYKDFEAGIITYGRFQFTLASGSLTDVVAAYLETASGPTADQLRSQYRQRIHSKDETLRQDAVLKALLLKAADEPAMQQAQDAIATVKHWDLVQGLSIQPRHIQTPLGQALLFDMAINHGPRHDMINLAEDALNVAPKSRMPDNGVQESELIARVVRIRQERMHKLADKHGWGGLRVRGDFWVDLVERGDWHLQGNDQGKIEVTPGRVVQVRG
jgi:hypothetical protein